MAVRVTGRIQIGRFVFEVGAPEGTRADLATTPGGADPGQLALALGQPGPTEIIGAAEQTLADAESVTGIWAGGERGLPDALWTSLACPQSCRFFHNSARSSVMIVCARGRRGRR